MKKSITVSFLLLIACSCLAQSIDTTALHILQKSYDRLSAMERITYRLTKIDTMIRENNFNVRWYTVRGTIKKKDYWHLRLENNAEWLIRGDTLYKNDDPDTKPVSFTTDWKRHEIGSFNIHNILGEKRPILDGNVTSLQFVQDTSGQEFYVIDEIRKMNYAGTDEIQSKVYFNRFWVSKASLFTTRRMLYSKSLDRGKEATDIYDFTASLEPNNSGSFNPSAFFHTSPVQEKNRFETLKVGTKATPIIATDVRTGKALNLNEFKGKVVLLDFWYLSCMPCRMLMPKLQKLQERFRNENVVIIGINVRDTAPKEIIRFLNEKQLLYAQYYQTGKLLAWDYKLQAFPTTVILGKDGRVKLVETGIAENTEQKLEEVIEKELRATANAKQ